MNPAHDTALKKRVLLAAGGTGGHISPALAVAEMLAELAPQVEVQFCCGNRPTELQIYRRQGVTPWVLPVAHNRPGLAERTRFLMRMWAAYRRARRLVREKPVQVAIGFGSYISVPPLLAARAGGARLAIQEQNVKAGAANRFLARRCEVIATAMETDEKRFPPNRTHATGNPVRGRLLRQPGRLEARRFCRLSEERPVVLVLGGSQGAQNINRIMLDLLGRLRDDDSPAGAWQLLWSTGRDHYQQVIDALRVMDIDPADHGINPFIDEMALAYGAADLVVARSGALTLAEITALGLPSVLIPLPTAAGGHQEHNARRLVEAGAAELLRENDTEAPEKLSHWLGQWAETAETLHKMGQAARTMGRPEAAREVAELILKLL